MHGGAVADQQALPWVVVPALQDADFSTSLCDYQSTCDNIVFL
ncbi:MAG: hypothetical protein RBT25_09745 [Lentisphaeria bacterium]|nr:hypothetical protein [Lentisphaeria bacterium]